MKTTKSKYRAKKTVVVDDTVTTTERPDRKDQRKKAAARAASGQKLGLKEQVKAGKLTAKKALTELSKKGSDAKNSQTYKWLLRRASKESVAKEVTSEAKA